MTKLATRTHARACVCPSLLTEQTDFLVQRINHLAHVGYCLQALAVGFLHVGVKQFRKENK